MPTPLQTYLRERISTLVDADTLSALVVCLEGTDPERVRETIQLGLLLSDYSRKAAEEYFRQLPGMGPLQSFEGFPAWVGIGMQVAGKSGTAAVRFFKESPGLLAKAAGSPRGPALLSLLRRVAASNSGLVLEAFRAGTELLDAAVPLEDWIEPGLGLCAREYTLAVEYLMTTPRLLRSLCVEDLPRWVETGLRLAEGERYFDTLVFFRSSAELFEQVPQALRSKLLALLWRIGEDAPSELTALIQRSPALLSDIQLQDRSGALAEGALDAAFQVAALDGALGATLLGHTPEVLRALGERAHRYLEWVSEGISLLAQGPERARGYFSLSSREGRASLDRLIGGLSLWPIKGVLERIAVALGGRPLAIRPLPPEQPEGSAPIFPKTDGWIVWLPPHLRLFSSDSDNFLWYKAAVAHAAGRIEFASDPLSAELLRRVGAWIAPRLGAEIGSDDPAAFFESFPEPQLIRDLFDLAEGARIDALLRSHYPGLSGDLDRVAAVTLDSRRAIETRSAAEAAVELLSQISLAGRTREPIPEPIQAILFEACRALAAVQQLEATVETSLRAACEAYLILDPPATEGQLPEGSMERFEAAGKGRRGRGEGEGNYRPADPVSHRGAADPEPALRSRRVLAKKAEEFLRKLKEAGIAVSAEQADQAAQDAYRAGEIDLENLQKDGPGDAWIAKAIEAVRREAPRGGHAEGKVFVYPEWDCTLGAYREGWCRLRETSPDPDSDLSAAFAERVRRERHLEIRQTVRLFQSLKPESLWKSKGEEDGEEIDLDALISHVAERRAGHSPSLRIYSRRNRADRSVAVAVLVDLSGSTARRIGADRSVLDVEKEGLVLLSEALAAVGDASAVYGFSGDGKDQVQFLSIKQFDEGWEEASLRIGALRSSHQNRDGTAIRHAVEKLSERPEKTKLLILMSDGRPLDQDYEGSYALQDTRRALQEGKARGIHSFCITVDREGADYLEGMYGEVAYTVVDDVASLPRRLPQLYRRLTT